MYIIVRRKFFVNYDIGKKIDFVTKNMRRISQSKIIRSARDVRAFVFIRMGAAKDYERHSSSVSVSANVGLRLQHLRAIPPLLAMHLDREIIGIKANDSQR